MRLCKERQKSPNVGLLLDNVTLSSAPNRVPEPGTPGLATLGLVALALVFVANEPRASGRQINADYGQPFVHFLLMTASKARKHSNRFSRSGPE